MNDDEPLEIIRGSGNVYQDFGCADADIRQAKAILGAQISKILDEAGMSTRQAQDKTGISHSDFSRIRRANFGRFTVDRLMAILRLLGQKVEVSVTFQPIGKPENPVAATRPAQL
jgi:predicted XRE-type DNA-binding protein